MPSPIGHALGGAIVSLLTAPKEHGAWGPGLGRNAFTLVALAAVLPDVDFLWGRHSMETHSVGAAVLVGLVVWVFNRRENARLALAVSLAWASHILFDWLGSDDTAPIGVMALWPLTSDFYFADAFVFEAISRRYWLPNFVSHNLFAVGKEIAMLAPVAWAVIWLRKRLES